MSALGDYVHLTAKNYQKYGITKKEPNNNFVNWQNEHQTLQMKIQNDQRSDAQELQIMQKLQHIQDTMWALQDTKDNDEAQLIQEIIKNEFFSKNSFDKYKEIIQSFNFGSGALEISAAGGKLRNGLNSKAMERMAKVGETFSRRLKSDSTFLKYQDEFDMRTLQSIINSIQDAVKILSNELDKNTISAINSALIQAQDAKDKLLKINANVRIKTGEQWMRSNKGKNTGVSLLGNNRTTRFVLKSDYLELMQAFQKLIALVSIPTSQITSMGGFFVESTIEAIATQGTQLSAKEATNHLKKAGNNGQSQSDINFKFDIPPEVSKALSQLVVKTETKKGNQATSNYSDFIKDGKFSYNSSSYQKADVTLEMDFESNDDIRKGNMVGLSLKSSSLKSDIHIVSSSPLMSFIFGWLQEVDKINHLINTLAIHEDDSQVNLESSRKSLRNALALSIIYSGLTGQNVGKTSGFAEYLVIVKRVNNRDNMYVINMSKFIRSLNQEALNSFITLSDGQTIDNLLFSQHSVDMNEGPSEISAAKRIASLIARMHQIKVSASIKPGYITTNYKVNNQV